MGIKSRTFDIPSTSADANGVVPGDKSYRVKLTEKEKKRVETLIRNAKSLQEITRLEKVRGKSKRRASERVQYSITTSLNK